MQDEKKRALIEDLARGNKVELDTISRVDSQLEELEKAGIVQKHGYSLNRPLGRLVQAAPKGMLANVDRLTGR